MVILPQNKISYTLFFHLSDFDVSTLSQTTNFLPFQSKEFADDNFEFAGNGRKFSKKRRKHCGKRRNCSLRSISPFPTVFSKKLVLQTRKNQGFFGKGLRCSPPSRSCSAV